MATQAGANATLLKGINEGRGIIPGQTVTDIFDKIAEESVVTKTAGTTPMPITGTSFVVPVGEVNAGVVGEGMLKPISKGGSRFKEVRPVKFATIMYFSDEMLDSNSAYIAEYFKGQMTDAIKRSVDAAVIYGRDVISGQQIPGVEYINQSTNRFNLGDAAKKDGGIFKDLVNGASAISAKRHSIDGFMADESLRYRLNSETDLQGRPIQGPNFNIANSSGSLLGFPVNYSRNVSGNMGNIEDTGVRAIAGNFRENVHLGYVRNNVTFRRTNEATLFDEGDWVPLFQTNMQAFLVEAQIGWAITDPDAFAIYTDKQAAAAISGGNTGAESGAAA